MQINSSPMLESYITLNVHNACIKRKEKHGLRKVYSGDRIWDLVEHGERWCHTQCGIPLPLPTGKSKIPRKQEGAQVKLKKCKIKHVKDNNCSNKIDRITKYFSIGLPMLIGQ